MDLSFTEEQEMLKRSAREFLQRECPKSLVRDMEKDPRGIPLGLWKKMGEMGWLGIAYPERYGGGGQSFLDIAILLEEMGRALVPGPVIQTVVSCGMAILEFGAEEQRRRFLPGIAKGETLMALAFIEPGTSYEEISVSTLATPEQDGFRVEGTKLFVPYASAADYFLVVARSSGRKDAAEGVTALLVDARSPGVEMEPLAVRGKDKSHQVRFKNVAVPRESLLGQAGKGGPIVHRIRDLSAVAQCAEIAGACGAITDMAVEYAKNRVQFGRPIGSFQAVQRHCVDMWADSEGARYVTYEAAWRLSAGVPAAKEIGMAKSFVSDACRRVIESGHQVHGAVGLTDEHDLTLYNRRLTLAAVNYGPSAFYREIVAREMGM